MATKTATKIKPMKKMAKGGQSKRCPRGQAYDISLGRCVDIDSESQSVLGYSLKGGINWFGEDSKQDGEYAREREATKNKVKGEALGKAAAAGMKKLLGYQKGGATKKKKYQDGGILTPHGRIKSKKVRNVDLTGRQTTADVSKTKRDGTTVTKSINTSRGFAPTATKTKTVTDKSGNVISKEQEGIDYNKAVRKTKRVARNVGRNANDTYAYKTGGMVNPNAKMQAQKAAGSKGVKPGVNPKASAANTASSKGSGKANTPPSKATPAAKYGKMMKKGGMVKAKKK